jgi:hypothetical protein
MSLTEAVLIRTRRWHSFASGQASCCLSLRHGDRHTLQIKTDFASMHQRECVLFWKYVLEKLPRLEVWCDFAEFTNWRRNRVLNRYTNLQIIAQSQGSREMRRQGARWFPPGKWRRRVAVTQSRLCNIRSLLRDDSFQMNVIPEAFRMQCQGQNYVNDVIFRVPMSIDPCRRTWCIYTFNIGSVINHHTELGKLDVFVDNCPLQQIQIVSTIL